MAKVESKRMCVSEDVYGPIDTKTQEEIDAITSPDNGQTIYNSSTSSINIYDNTYWVDLTKPGNFLNNMAMQQPNLGTSGEEIIYSGGSMFMEIEAEGGGDIYFWLNNEVHILDCTYNGSTPGKARVELLSGTTEEPLAQTVYAYLSGTSVKLGVVADIPDEPYLPICYLSLQDSGSTQTNGPIRIQRTTETTTHNEQGAISRMREHIRLVRKSAWWEGVEPSLITGSTIDFETTFGIVYQMNRQIWGNTKLSEDGAFLINQKDHVNDFTKYTDFANITKDGLNETIETDDYIIIDIMGGINNNETNNKIFFTVSEKYDSTEIPAARYSKFPRTLQCIKTITFPIARIILKKVASGFENYFTDIVPSWKTVTPVSGDGLTWTSPNYNGIDQTYYNDADEYFNFTGPAGTTKMRLFFADFRLEYVLTCGYDYLTLKDQDGNNFSPLIKWCGHKAAFTTNDLTASQIQCHFHTDSVVVDYGFDISAYEYYSPSETQSNRLLDMRE